MTQAEGVRIHPSALVEDDDEHNLFRINRDHFVVEWIKVMPLPDDHRVAYVKRITMDRSPQRDETGGMRGH